MTTISLSYEIKEELQKLGKKSDTYEGIIKRLLEFYKKHGGESP